MSDARDELVARVSRNLAAIRERIASVSADPDAVRIVAVTKLLDPSFAHAALDAGICDLAENRVDELEGKHDAVARPNVTWHFIGPLQRNKLARLAPRVAVYQSLARTEEVAALARLAPRARCYVQVNVAGDAHRNGCSPSDAGRIARAALGEGLVVEGLMCIAAPEPALADAQFAGLRALADDLGLPGCSMGMSGDLEAACARGSTMVRVGTALFGARPTQPSAAVA